MVRWYTYEILFEKLRLVHESNAEISNKIKRIENALTPGVCVLTESQFDTLKAQLDVPFLDITSDDKGHVTKFESHVGMDIISLSIPEIACPRHPLHELKIYLRRDFLLFVTTDSMLLNLLYEKGPQMAERAASVGRVLYGFFEHMIEEDMACLEDREQDISDLEDDVLSDIHGSRYRVFLQQISAHRKDLMVLTRYYEQLLDIAQLILENENGFFEKELLRYFRIFEGKVDRLCDFISHLRGYVTQVREAYQAQVDINSNNVMKFFTVLTAVFLPLTLIAGWYGMNLQMPEYGVPYAYPIIVGISVVLVAGIIVWMKRKNWF